MSERVRSGVARQRWGSRLRLGTWLPPLVALAAAVGAWELIALHNRLVLPTIGAVISELAHNKLLFAHDAGTTLEETVVGLAASFVVALSLAIVMSQVRLVERALMPLAVVLNVTPLVSLAPGLAIVFGFNLTPKFLVTAIIVFFPFLVNALVGLRSVEVEALEVLRTVHASRAEILWHLQLPSSLPFLFAAARICFPLSLVGAVVAELTVSGGTGGLGVEIGQASAETNLAPIYASVLCLAVIGVVLFLLVVAIEHRALGWYRVTRPSR